MSFKLREGDTVRFNGSIPEQVKWGRTDDPKELVLGETYVVATAKVFPYYTHVTLEDIKGTFNSVHFTAV